MKLAIRQILDIEGERLDFAGAVDLSWVKRHGETLFPEALAVSGSVENRAGVVTLRYQISGVMPCLCDRCLMQSERLIRETFTHTVVRQLADDALDDVFLTAPDDTLSLGEIAGADLQLFLPQVLLCREDCRGLCPVCGADLNQTNCGCRRNGADPRLEILRDLL
jgi:uncharacterized protein